MSAIDSTFVSLRRDLKKAYGWGLFPDKEKITSLVQEALNLTESTPIHTRDEYEFYRSASKRIAPATVHLDSIVDAVDQSEALVTTLEKASQDTTRKFLSKNEEQRKAFFDTEEYRDLEGQAITDAEMFQVTAQTVKNCLFQREKDSDPFQDIDAFADRRKTVTDSYKKASDLGIRHARAMEAISPESLFEAAKNDTSLSRKIAKHPYFISVPIGAAIAAAGAFKLPDATHRMIAYGAGTLVTIIPWIFKK